MTSGNPMILLPWSSASTYNFSFTNCFCFVFFTYLQEYRKKISQLQNAEEEKQMLQMENARLWEEMQDRCVCVCVCERESVSA